MELSFVEFEFTDDQRFTMLVNVFDASKAAKQSDSFPPDEYWFPFFDKEALSHFWRPTEEEIQDWKRRWEATSIPQRFTDPSLQRPWLFGSMLDAFHDGEYELVGCTRLSNNRGRLEFIPYAGPYGGTDCIKALIEAFGFKVVGEFE